MLNFKQSEYSQFMQNRDMANAGNNTQSDLNRSEFNAPVEPADYEHLYQTLSNMPYNKEDFETDKNQSKIPSLMTKVKVFSPTVVNHKQGRTTINRMKKQMSPVKKDTGLKLH